jgi:alpha-L-arabinofuranosidase
VAAAGIKAVRYPGGSYADIVHWQTCSSCGGYTAPGACFDSFINNLVTPAGATAIITVNYGSNPTCDGGGDTNEAAAWVAYANMTNHLGIKYWEIGNEQGGNGYYGTTLVGKKTCITRHCPRLLAASANPSSLPPLTARIR